MYRLKVIIKRLKTPSVLISIFSHIVTIILLFRVNDNLNIFTGVMTSVCSILILMGILSDPNTQNRGYGDDFAECTRCHRRCEHVYVNGDMICRECGCVNCIKKE